MKRLFGILFILLISSAGNVFAQSAVASVQNVQVSGNQVSFDLYLKNTGSTTFYLCDATLYFSFNNTKFSNTTATFTNSLPASYSSDIQFIAQNKFGIDVLAPFPATTTNTLSISATGNGSKIGTVVLTGLNSFTGTLGLDWTVSPSQVLSRWNEQTNFCNNITSVTTYNTPPSITLGPLYDVIIKNQQLLNNEYTFDVYMKKTGGNDMYLDDCDLIISFDNTKFSGLTASVVAAGTAKLSSYYLMVPSIQNTNKLALTISQNATINNQTDFDTKIEQIASSGNGTKVVTLKIVTANNGVPVSAINPLWFTSGSPTLNIYNRRNQTPWNFSDDVKGNATFLVDAPVTTITVTAPNGSQSLCPGSTYAITWTSLNVLNAKIELMDGVTPTTIINSTSAPAGTYLWTVPNLPGSNYKIKVSDASNPSISDLSDASFNINALPAISVQPANQTACPGTPVTLSVTASGSGILYQWKKEGVDIPGATLSSYTIASVSAGDAGSYSVTVTGVCSPSVTSSNALLTMLTAPSITTQPQPQTVLVSSTASFSVIATGTGITYQWQKQSTGGTYQNIAGANASTFSISNAQLTDAGNYRVVVSGTCTPSTTSSVVTLFVNPLNSYVNVKVYFQGYWNNNTSVHVKSPVSVEVRSGAGLSTSALVQVQTGMLSSTGTINVAFPNLASGSYWLVVRHGGHIAIAANGTLAITPGNTVSYDFTDSQTKSASLNSIVQVGNVFAVRAGDLDGNLTVNAIDALNYFTPNMGVGVFGIIPAP